MKRLYISINNSKSIDKVIKELEKYRDSLDDKTQIFIKRLSEVGIKALNAKLQSISPFYKGEDIDTSSEIHKSDDGWSATISMTGSQSVFIEFGAGVTFNAPKHQSLHPKGEELGLTIGSYNESSPNATNPNGWWYTDKWGESQHTYGTPTFAPMYKSSIEMMAVVRDIASEVFGNG